MPPSADTIYIGAARPYIGGKNMAAIDTPAFIEAGCCAMEMYRIGTVPETLLVPSASRFLCSRHRVKSTASKASTNTCHHRITRTSAPRRELSSEISVSLLVSSGSKCINCCLFVCRRSFYLLRPPMTRYTVNRTVASFTAITGTTVFCHCMYSAVISCW